MRIRALFRRLAAALRAPAPVIDMPPAVQPLGAPRLRVSDTAVRQAGVKPARRDDGVWKMPDVPPGVIPKAIDKKAVDKLAFDDASMLGNFSWAQSGMFSEGLEFMGYAYLAELTQRAEYRRPAEVLAKQMTRKWIKLICANSEADKQDRIDELQAAMRQFQLQAIFQKAAEHDGYFGRAQIYVDTGATDNPDELKMELVDLPGKIGKGGLKGFTVVEPIWTYPNYYNSIDPLKGDYFRPRDWFVMGKLVHTSRLLTFVSRPVPDMLKPAYAFGGLSLSQMAKPYIDNWLRTRQSVSDLLHSFSVMGVKTNLSAVLNGGDGQDMLSRLALFNQCRDNRGLMVLDKDTEEFFNVAAPLGSLDKLQAQSQEHMAAVTGIPLVILLGITPTGLNASSEGELETFYAWIHAQQEATLAPNLKRALDLLQLHLWGEIDAEISFEWEPLWTLDDLQLAQARKTEAETDVILIDGGVISPEESRQRVANEEDSPYVSLDPNDVPDPPEPDVGSIGGGKFDLVKKEDAAAKATGEAA